MAGTLYVVATPIGNLEDISYRAVRVLNEVDMVAAEDTRNTIKLLNHYEIKNRLISYHEHNKFEMGPRLIAELENDKDIALVSDAGTPGISDPGEHLIMLCYEKGINVTMLPGCSALIMAAVLSNLTDGKFVFEGFLPTKLSEKKAVIEGLCNSTKAVIFYEAPHKLLKTLNNIYEIFGERKIALCRELTKKYEEIERIMLTEAIEKYEKNAPRGEFVIVVEGKKATEIDDEKNKMWDNISLEAHYRMYVDKGMKRNEAIKQVASDRGVKKKDIYDLL